MMSSKINYVSLHNHTGYSAGDGMGLPSAHLDSAYAAGNNAHAITDHGNASSLANAYLHSLKMKKEGKDFKYIKGVEAYFIPSVQEWKELKGKLKEEAEENKKKVNDEEDVVAAEDENESKSKQKNPLIKRSHLVLLAQNEIGYKNICRLVTRSQSGDNFYVKPRMDFELLRNNSEGLICTTACIGSALNSFSSFWEGDYKKTKEQQKELIKKFQSIFGDRFFLELQFNMIPEQHIYNDLLIQLSDELSIPLTVASDCHYPKKELWKDREIYRQIAMLSQKKEFEPIPDTLEEMRYELFPKNGDEMMAYALRTAQVCNANYDERLIREAIERTQFISNTMIEDYKINTEIKFPTFANAPGKTGAETLREMAFAKLCEKGLDNSKYSERLNYELEVIEKRNMSEYFLIMKEIVSVAERTTLTSTGRGSSAGCLLSYCIGLTKIDPIRHELQFERFLLPDGNDLPDIDMDFEDTSALKLQIQSEWKDKHNVDVFPITNYNRLQLRALIKDLSKMEGISFQEVNAVTSKMTFEATGPAKKRNGIEAGAYVPTYEETIEFSPTLRTFLDKYPKIATHIANIQGEIRNSSTHAAGIIYGENLEERLPMISRAGILQTPYTEGIASRELEPMGFQKADLLGLTTLNTIHYCIEGILKEQNGITPPFEEVKKWYETYLHPDKINFDDELVYKNVFDEAKYPGIFQFANKGAQEFATKAKPRSLNDLSNVTSIFRPGPLSSGIDKAYLEALAKPKSIKYDHESLRTVLGPTYGSVIYQESIAAVAHTLGRDLSLTEGNKLRKLLIKKGSVAQEELKEKIHQKFILDCADKDISEKKAKEIWKNLERFNTYGFPRAHGISYSAISFQCAYLFTYHEKHWLAAVLDKEPEDKKEQAIGIVQNLGYEVLKPDVNVSELNWIPVGQKQLVQPLLSLKGVGEKAIEQIILNKPFKTIEEFLFNENIVYGKLNKGAIDKLVRSRALDSLMDSRFVNLKHFWTVVAEHRPKNEKELLENIEKFKDVEDFSNEEKMNFLIDITGTFPFDLILTPKILNSLEKNDIPPISEYDEELGICWFIPREIETKITKNNKPYALIKTIDNTSTQQAIKCWNYDPIRDTLKLNVPYLAKLKHDDWGFSSFGIGNNFKRLA